MLSYDGLPRPSVTGFDGLGRPSYRSSEGAIFNRESDSITGGYHLSTYSETAEPYWFAPAELVVYGRAIRVFFLANSSDFVGAMSVKNLYNVFACLR